MRELTEKEIQNVNGGWVILAIRGAFFIASLFSIKKVY
jgi:lactobin A/cerein 7B family class IIb bacteriocin